MSHVKWDLVKPEQTGGMWPGILGAPGDWTRDARGLDLGPPGTRTGKEDPPQEPPGVCSPGPSLTLDRTVKGQTVLFSGPGCGHSLRGPGPELATLLPGGLRPERPAALTIRGAARSCSPHLRHPGLGTVYEPAELRHLPGGRGSCPWRRKEHRGTRQVAVLEKAGPAPRRTHRVLWPPLTGRLWPGASRQSGVEGRTPKRDFLWEGERPPWSARIQADPPGPPRA